LTLYSLGRLFQDFCSEVKIPWEPRKIKFFNEQNEQFKFEQYRKKSDNFFQPGKLNVVIVQVVPDP
jgi:hypothetical protein